MKVKEYYSVTNFNLKVNDIIKMPGTVHWMNHVMKWITVISGYYMDFKENKKAWCAGEQNLLQQRRR